MNHIIEQQKERAMEELKAIHPEQGKWRVERATLHDFLDTLITQTHQATIAEVVRIAHEMAGHSTIGSRARLLNVHQFIEAITSNKE